MLVHRLHGLRIGSGGLAEWLQTLNLEEYQEAPVVTTSHRFYHSVGVDRVCAEGPAPVGRSSRPFVRSVPTTGRNQDRSQPTWLRPRRRCFFGFRPGRQGPKKLVCCFFGKVFVLMGCWSRLRHSKGCDVPKHTHDSGVPESGSSI